MLRKHRLSVLPLCPLRSPVKTSRGCNHESHETHEKFQASALATFRHFRVFRGSLIVFEKGIFAVFTEGRRERERKHRMDRNNGQEESATSLCSLCPLWLKDQITVARIETQSAIPNRIGGVCFAEALESELTRITFTAGQARGIGVVATVSESVIDAQTQSLSNDVGLRE